MAMNLVAGLANMIGLGMAAANASIVGNLALVGDVLSVSNRLTLVGLVSPVTMGGGMCMTNVLVMSGVNVLLTGPLRAC